MVTALILLGDGRTADTAEPTAIAEALRDPAARFWVDLNDPSEEDFALLDDVFGFHPLAIEDCMGHVQRPKIESYNHVGDACRQGYFYMVIHGPDLDSTHERLGTRELDLFVSERYLVTIHENGVRPVDERLARARRDIRSSLEQGIDVLLYNILDVLVDNYLPILDGLQENLTELEDRALSDPGGGLLNEISTLKRDLLNLRRTVGPQREVIAQLTRGDVPFIREGTRIYLRDVLDHLIRIVETVELYRELISGARDIYLSAVNNNLNQIVKTLTIFTVVVIPLNVISGFFGMNFEHIPGLHSPLAFWATVAVMAASAGCALFLFRRWKWI